MGSITFSMWQALVVFIVINSITPGPNNLMLLQGGLRKGYRGCIMHIIGIEVGTVSMIVCSYAGMGALFHTLPAAFLLMKGLGCAYLLWLTWHIWQTGLGIKEDESVCASENKWLPPLSLWQAAVFQWLNPKVLLQTVLLPGYVLIPSATPWLDNWPVIAVYVPLNFLCVSVWAAGGQSLRRLLNRPRALVGVHYAVVLGLLYCAVALWL
ncbi:LysE family translocator [Cardiobacteriaceae bacterium TAE3-ERU3]|nr:LysE family translocator [Cardiobacteriaceae bacterium TAE3-ERU3]